MLLSLLLLSFVAGEVYAELPRIKPQSLGEVVGVIKIEGNRRVSTDEILYNIEMAPQEVLNLDVVSKDVKRLYGMGFFEDIQVDATRNGDKLVVTYILKEKPAVARITFEGNEELDREELLEQVNINIPSILSQAKVKANAKKLQALYADKGFYLAEVTSKIVPLAGGDTEVLFSIKEYAQVKVRKITFIGNKAISDEELKGNIFTRELSPLGFMTQAGEFKSEEFERDLQRLSFYYADHGYPDAKVSEPRLRLSPDRKSIFVTITIDEGPQYKVDFIDLRGDLIDEKEKLLGLLRVKEGENFSLSVMFKDIERLRNRYRDEGYAYANIEPKQRKERSADGKSGKLTLVYDIKQGELVKFGRIKIVGNVKTADKVIRRELLIHEGEQFSGSNLDRSRRNAMRLGFFEKVDITTQASTDRRFIDVQVEVKEKPTGTFQVGAGFSSVESFIATIQVSQENFLGRGQSLTAQATFSGIRQLFNIQFFEPYFFDTRWRFRASVYNFEYLFNDFSRSSTGGTIGLGYPLSRAVVLDLNYTLEDVVVTPGGRLGRAQRNVGSLFQGGLTSSLGTTISYDTRNNRLFPSQGVLLQGTAEIADDTLLSENQFTRLIARTRFYTPLFFNFVLKFNIETGLVSNWNSDNKPVPLFERFFVGGPNSVRGFFRSTLGPSREIASNSSDPGSQLTTINVGGDKQFIFNVELEFPILTSVGLKGVFFADAGNAFDNNQSLSLKPDFFSDESLYEESLRTSVGFGIRWQSPIGPLRFEWGIPLAPLPEEEDLVFEFSIGNSF